MTTSARALPRQTSRVGTAATWTMQVLLAVVFAGAGLTKLGGDAAMVSMFDDIGAGQWLRYVVGALELAGAAGLLIPRLAGLAASGLAALMVGAITTNLLILSAGVVLPICLLALALAVAWVRRPRPTTTGCE